MLTGRRLIASLLALLPSAHAEPPRMAMVEPVFSTTSGTLIDVDGDGDLDWLSGGETATLWWENLGDRTFAPPRVWFYHPGNWSNLYHDLDGDGLLDQFAFGIGTSNQFSWLRASRSAAYVEPATIDLSTAYGSRPIELDGDPPTELLERTTGDKTRIWNLTETGDLAPFGEAAEEPTGVLEGSAWQVVALDVDGDGDLDLAGPRFVHIRSGPEAFEPSPLELPLFDARWADLDGDGLPDRFEARSGTFLYSLNLGALGFSEPVEVSYADHGLVDDSGLEFLTTEPGASGAVLVFRKVAGSGIALELVRVPFPAWDEAQHVSVPAILPPYFNRMVLSDIDGDGWNDLLIESVVADTYRLHLQAHWGSDAGFSAGAPLLPAGIDPKIRLVADFDGNGAPDLFVCESEGDRATILWNDGSGNFAAPQPIHPLLPANLAAAGAAIAGSKPKTSTATAWRICWSPTAAPPPGGRSSAAASSAVARATGPSHCRRFPEPRLWPMTRCFQ